MTETPHIWGTAGGHLHTHADFPAMVCKVPVHPLHVAHVAHDALHACREVVGAGVGPFGAGVARRGVGAGTHPGYAR